MKCDYDLPPTNFECSNNPVEIFRTIYIKKFYDKLPCKIKKNRKAEFTKVEYYGTTRYARLKDIITINPKPMNREKDNRTPFDWELYQKGYEVEYFAILNNQPLKTKQWKRKIAKIF